MGMATNEIWWEGVLKGLTVHLRGAYRKKNSCDGAWWKSAERETMSSEEEAEAPRGRRGGCQNILKGYTVFIWMVHVLLKRFPILGCLDC